MKQRYIVIIVIVLAASIGVFGADSTATVDPCGRAPSIGVGPQLVQLPQCVQDGQPCVIGGTPCCNSASKCSGRFPNTICQ